MTPAVDECRQTAGSIQQHGQGAALRPAALVLCTLMRPRSAQNRQRRALFCALPAQVCGTRGGTTHDDEMDQSIRGSPEHGRQTLGRMAAGGGRLHRDRTAGKAGWRPGGPDRRAGRGSPGKSTAPTGWPNPSARARPRRLLEAFADPFSLVLLLLAVVSAFTDIVFVAPAQRNYMTVGYHHGDGGGLGGAAACAGDPQRQRGRKAVRHDPHHRLPRAGRRPAELPMEEIAVGDIVYLSAGDMIRQTCAS